MSDWGDIYSSDEDSHSLLDDISDGDDASHLGDEDSDQYDGPKATHRLMYSGHSTLSNYMQCHSHGMDINTGYITDERYIIPLHIPPLVVGHIHERIAVCDTGTTKLPLLVRTSYMVNPMFQFGKKCTLGSKGLAEALTYIDNQMICDDLKPPGFMATIDLTSEPDSPITLGHKGFPRKYDGVTLSTNEDSRSYVVPTSCPDKRYLAPCGLGSTMVANSVVLTFPGVNQYLVKPEQRQPHECETGFLCQSSSSSSAALKGLVRYVCTGTVCRCYNMGVGLILQDISARLVDNNCGCRKASVAISIAGLDYDVCDKCFSTIRQMLDTPSYLGPHVPTLQKTSNDMRYTISFCTGALMRMISDGKWISTKQDSNDDLQYHNVLSPCASLTPFPSNINATRLGLSNIYLQQAVCEPYSDYIAGMKLMPRYSEASVLMPDFMPSVDHIIDAGRSSMPGLNLRAVFMNMQQTYEDGIVMSRSASQRFNYEAEVRRTVNASDRNIPDVGATIDPWSYNWWQCHFAGVIKTVEQIDPDRTLLVITCDCHPVNGDKFTTLHGQKGVITILADHNMPYVNGNPAEIVIGSSSILKRGTVSQLLEAAYAQYAIDHMDAGLHLTYNDAFVHYSTSTRTQNCSLTRVLQLYEADIVINEHPVARKVHRVGSNISEKRNVRANYGTIRVMQSCFLASHRVSATSSMSSRFVKKMNTSSSSGGSKSLGEMEVTQLIASGLSHCITELSDRSDVHLVDVCTHCRLLDDICDCEHKGNSLDKMLLPLDAIKYAYASRIALNMNIKLT